MERTSSIANTLSAIGNTLSAASKNWFLQLITRVVNQNFFTTLGFLVSILSAALFVLGYSRWGGALVLLSGTFDIMDGKVARATNQVTKFGALYDSTLDRYAEVVVFFGLTYFFDRGHIDFLKELDSRWRMVAVIAVLAALGGSMMVSYVRARAEGLGLQCKVGIMQRPERIVLLGLGALIHEIVLLIAVGLIAVLSNFTAFQRLMHVRNEEMRLNIKTAKKFDAETAFKYMEKATREGRTESNGFADYLTTLGFSRLGDIDTFLQKSREENRKIDERIEANLKQLRELIYVAQKK